MQQSKMKCEIYIFNFGYLSSDDTAYLCEQGCEDPWLSYEAKRVHGQKNWRNTALDIHQSPRYWRFKSSGMVHHVNLQM